MDTKRAQESIWASASSGVGGGSRGILHGDAVCLGIGHVDVVDADAAADDELQAGALRSIDVIGAHLGGRADDHDVKVADGLAQLLGRVELLDHFVALRAQGLQRGLIHSISNENTHGRFSFQSGRSVLGFKFLQAFHEGLHAFLRHGVVG